MSRRECKHGRNCGDELCPVDDPSGLVLECSEYEDSGRMNPKPRSGDVIRKLLDAEIEAFQRYKHGGFRFGEGEIAQKEAQRRRAKIAALRRELGEV